MWIMMYSFCNHPNKSMESRNVGLQRKILQNAKQQVRRAAQASSEESRKNTWSWETACLSKNPISLTRGKSPPPCCVGVGQFAVVCIDAEGLAFSHKPIASMQEPFWNSIAEVGTTYPSSCHSMGISSRAPPESPNTATALHDALKTLGYPGVHPTRPKIHSYATVFDRAFGERKSIKHSGKQAFILSTSSSSLDRRTCAGFLLFSGYGDCALQYWFSLWE